MTEKPSLPLCIPNVIDPNLRFQNTEDFLRQLQKWGVPTDQLVIQRGDDTNIENVVLKTDQNFTIATGKQGSVNITAVGHSILEELRDGKPHDFSPEVTALLSGLTRQARENIHRILLAKHLPCRNPDGSMNWANVFANAMLLARPVKRSDVFPEGTKGMTEEAILARAHEFMEPLSIRNLSPASNAWDPVEFPEVIDEDFRKMAGRLNSTEFMRTTVSCSGHPDKKNGYRISILSLDIDWRDPKATLFYDAAEDTCRKFKSDQINAYTEKLTRYDPGGLIIRLRIAIPDGENTETYPTSAACKKIRDDFWAEIEEAAELTSTEAPTET